MVAVLLWSPELLCSGWFPGTASPLRSLISPQGAPGPTGPRGEKVRAKGVPVGWQGSVGKGLAVTPVSLQGDPGPPGRPVSDAAQQLELCLPQPQHREPWAVPSMVSSASPAGSQRGWCWREGNPGPAVPSTLWAWLWA